MVLISLAVFAAATIAILGLYHWQSSRFRADCDAIRRWWHRHTPLSELLCAGVLHLAEWLRCVGRAGDAAILEYREMREEGRNEGVTRLSSAIARRERQYGIY